MSFSIGLRFYKITIRRKRDEQPLPIGPSCEPVDLYDFLSDFISRKQAPTEEVEELRTWYFEPKPTPSIRTLHGYLHYGTHGFESKLKDNKTKKEKYKRLSTDVEEVPLYYQFWVPSGSDFAIFGFQSFAGRSCINFVRSSITKSFSYQFENHLIAFKAIIPANAGLGDAPVKSIVLRRSSNRADKSDTYRLGRHATNVEIDLTVRARGRNSFLGTYKELKGFLSGEEGSQVVEFDGEEYTSARADVKFGGRRRIVGVFGSGVDAGVIEASDKVKRGPDGHPVFDSIASEVDQLMEDFYAGIKT